MSALCPCSLCLMTLVLAVALAPAFVGAGDKALEKYDGPLASVRRFGYQLQKLDVKEAAAAPADLLVIDPERDGGRLTAAQVTQLQKKPDGSKRLVLAYLSIGEAEDYRPYWKKEWRQKPPAWLGPENPQWKGNFKVRFWDADWQALILGRPETPLERIVADGYDGVYLDIIDAFEFWEERGVKDARTRMVAWVRKIAGQARQKQPGFLVVPQNGEALAREKDYLSLIDAIGREDLYFDGDKPQKKSEIAQVEADLQRFRKAGKPVFVIEYCKQAKNAQEAYRRATAAGFVALVTVRPLDRLIVTPAPADK
jgi:cysteinyl-tRNA synthetase, unknown class